MPTAIDVTFNGMNNRLTDERIPAGTARNAVNVMFGDSGEIFFPRLGKQVQYSGNCSSLHQTALGYHFVEGGVLKLLKLDNTVTILRSGMGTSRVFYTSVGATTYFANQQATGRIDGMVCSEWGCAVPPRQPDITASNGGGLFAGDYCIAITWWGTTEESGALTSTFTRTSVASLGGSLILSNFPKPPSYVTQVGVYVTSVNGNELYLYGLYPSTVQSVTIIDTINATPLVTQFGIPPQAKGKIISHMGRMYYADGNLVRKTEPFRYGLEMALNYWPFDSDVQVIASCPPMLYINTLTTLYQVSNIDAIDGSPPKVSTLQKGGAVPCSEVTNPEDGTVYFLSDKGIVNCTPQGVTLVTYNNNAIPFFKEGDATIVEFNGSKSLIFMGSNGTQNPLANTQFNVEELARNTL